MKKLFYLSVFLLMGHGAFCQSFWKPYVEADIYNLDLAPLNSRKQEKAYRIWYSFQVVELIKINASTYVGQIVSSVQQGAISQVRHKRLAQKLSISGDTVKKLMERLEKENIETLPDMDKVLFIPPDTLPDGLISIHSVVALDGTPMLTEVSTSDTLRLYYYNSPESLHLEYPQVKEVENAYHIIHILQSELRLQKVFSDFQKSVPKGTGFLMGPG